MRDAKPGTIFLEDYQAPAYFISRTKLDFELHEDHTVVVATLHIWRNPESAAAQDLVLHGQELELLSIALDGEDIPEQDYSVGSETLTVSSVPDQFTLRCTTKIKPQENTSLEGLYKSRTMFCTQCEAEGFRKITYYLDRPDVMSVFTVSIDADATRYPVLLSNGNLEESGASASGRHRVSWHDPHPKPAYLFALVAGDLEFIEDSFTTCGKRDVTLRIYVESKDLGKCDHAMASLKRSMLWDEVTYGREYDLDIFNIVAVDDFNMGAMENKSLNIFNSSCVLASPETTTDAGFARVEAIVAHEYFHNWSGNRVTCRDWFQLSLKEGFTVFRDAEFSADMGSRTVKRVEDVSLLRTVQFAEDGGPMAHPVRPNSFIEISNFYTVTIYEKGAEVVRMIHTLLGVEKFRAGSDLYFERHDGQAVTCEDFVLAMEEASGVDLTQFRLWYSQAGTPTIEVSGEYDQEQQTYTLHVKQSCPATPGQSDKEPFLIPLAMGLLGEAGNMPLKMSGEQPDPETSDNTHRILMVDKQEQSFVFEQVAESPVPSLLRSFSAPVRLQSQSTREDLYALMSRDDDGFVRWDSGQQMALSVIDEVQSDMAAGREPTVDPLLTHAFQNLLQDESLDAAMVAEMLTLPGENYLAELASQNGGADVESIHTSRNLVKSAIAVACSDSLQARFGALASDEEYAPTAPQVAARSLRNVCLEYLVVGDVENILLAQDQFFAATNMTDRLAALRIICFYGTQSQSELALDQFYQQWREETLVVNQWFQLQASIPGGDGIARVQSLMSHPDFDLKNPNKIRALVGAFANNNPINFHRKDGQGYRLLTDVVIELNTLNPQIASRLLNPLTKWRNYAGREELMKTELERLAALPNLSKDVFEIVTKSLG
ncbi:MAG: aminopeptidase N [Halioglobus sp.]|jgi:aminopeptidase N